MKMSDEFDIDETLILLVEMRHEQRLAFFKDAVQTFWRGWRAIDPKLTPKQFVEEVSAWRDMIDRRAFELNVIEVAGHA